MKNFVHQTECIELSGAGSLFWEMRQIALLVDLVGEKSHGVEIGKQDIAIQCEECLVEMEFIARLP
jgi:hypothetical protein